MPPRTDPAAKSRKRTARPIRRGKGRPQSTGDAVGREALVASTVELLKLKPHSQINRLEIARFAGVDPGLIRYYFGDVQRLLGQVAVQIILDARVSMDDAPGASIEERLRTRIRRTVQLLVEYPHLHALILEVVFTEENTTTREYWRQIIKRSISQLEELLREGEQKGVLRYVEPRYLHLTIVGACEFLVSGRALLTDMFGRKQDPEQMREAFIDFFADLLLKGLMVR